MFLIRRTLFLVSRYSFPLRVSPVRDTDNASAAALSRLHVRWFRRLRPSAAARATRLPPALAAFLEAPTETCPVATDCQASTAPSAFLWESFGVFQLGFG